MRITSNLLLKQIHSRKNLGMTHTDIVKWYCQMKGYDHDLHERVEINGYIQYLPVHRGIHSTTMLNLRKKGCITKFGNRHLVTAAGVRQLQSVGYL